MEKKVFKQSPFQQFQFKGIPATANILLVSGKCSVHFQSRKHYLGFYRNLPLPEAPFRRQEEAEPHLCNVLSTSQLKSCISISGICQLCKGLTTAKPQQKQQMTEINQILKFHDVHLCNKHQSTKINQGIFVLSCIMNYSQNKDIFLKTPQTKQFYFSQ